jgi:transposase-like protein
MNILPRDKQIEIVAALTEGVSIRATERLAGVHRDTIMRLGVRVGQGCASLHNSLNSVLTKSAARDSVRGSRFG